MCMRNAWWEERREARRQDAEHDPSVREPTEPERPVPVADERIDEPQVERDPEPAGA